MKLLFLARHFGYLRNYESAILELARRGHTVHLAADREEALGGRQMVERWAQAEPRITVGWTPDRESDDWFWLATRLRQALDLVRFQDARYDQAAQLRARAQERVPTMILGVLTLLGYRLGPLRALWTRVLSAFERAIPLSPALAAMLQKHAPDLVLVTPLVELGSPQADHLRSAKAAGVRTALAVGSWDHLSSKALVRDRPQQVFVWNETQKREAIDLHGLPAEGVVVTGAQCFDHWFERQPTLSRHEFLTRLSLPTDKPLIVWLCSSLFRGSPLEAPYVVEWLQQLRNAPDPRLREANVLIRPHPQRNDEWRRVDLSHYGKVAVRGGYPIDEDAKAAYFDALYHADAVVGLNTSALIEAGIVGRPVLSIVDARYAHNQEGTLHWPYLVEVGGGLIQVSRGFPEHIEQLSHALHDVPPPRDAFVQAFVRPYGLDAAATPRFVDALEALVASPAPVAEGAPSFGALLRPFMWPLIWLRRSRADWVFYRKRSKRDFKRWWQGTQRSVRQGLKSLVRKRMRAEQPRVILTKTEKVRLRSQDLFQGVEEVEETKEILTRIARSGRPIIVGPWLSETGFELLYWIPFLNWAKTYGNIRDDRLIVVSRGGCHTWYRHLTANYHDVFDFFTPEEFRAKNEARIQQQGGLKHVSSAAFDEEIIARVKQAAGARDAEVLHPSLMYKLFAIFWRLEASVGLFHGFTLHRRIEAPPLGDLAAHLPKEFVAAKFYGSNSFPDNDANRQFLTTYLSQLSASHHVVLLNTGVRFDDHDDFAAFRRDRIHTVDHLMTPRNNLDIQTRIIAHAQAFVGTYGGFSYMAPLVGVNTLAFYSNPSGFRMDHLEIAKRVFTELNTASFIPLLTKDLDVLRLTVGDLSSARSLSTVQTS